MQFAGPGLGELQGEVERGVPQLGVDVGDLEAGQVEGGGRGVLEDHHDLEQRGAAGVADRLDLVHDLLERRLLVGEGVQDGLADVAEELGERAVGCDAGAQDEGVDEEPDEVLDLGAVAAGGDRADGDVLASGQAGQVGLGGGDEGGEEGGLPVAAHPGQAAGGLAGQGEPYRGAVVGAHRGAGAVGGQVQRLQPGQVLLPVGQVVVGAAAALPVGVVGVLHRQRRQRACLRAEFGAVEVGEVAGEDAGGPAVGDDVVQGQRQHVLVVREPDQARVQEGAAPQVEGAGAFGVQQVREPGVAFAAGELRQVVQGQRHVPGRVDDLHAVAVDRVEGGAQRLVPLDQGAQGRGEGGHVEPAAQPQGQRGDVLAAAGRELLQEPQALLGVRHRGGRVAGDRGDRRGRRVGGAFLGEQGGEGLGGRVGEHRARGQFGAERLGQADGEADAEDGVASELEEVVPHAGARHGEDVGEDLQRAALGVGAGLGGRVLCAARGFGSGQGRPVDLAVAAERQRGQDDERRRHEVVRQGAPGELPQEVSSSVPTT